VRRPPAGRRGTAAWQRKEARSPCPPAVLVLIGCGCRRLPASREVASLHELVRTGRARDALLLARAMFTSRSPAGAYRGSVS
jgi:hypothetical protein